MSKRGSTAIHVVLTDLEATRLTACEKVIERGIASFLETGEALLTIRDNRLYRSSFSTFEDYCKERWGMTSRRAGQLIDAYEVVEALPEPEPAVEAWDSQEVGNMFPSSPKTRASINARQAAELAPLRNQPEVMREVWQQTVEETDGKPTAIAIRERVEARRADGTGDKIAAEISAAIRNLRLAHEHALRARDLADRAHPTKAPAILRAVVEDHPEWEQISHMFWDLQTLGQLLDDREKAYCDNHPYRTRGVRVIRTTENGMTYGWACCPECAALKEGQSNEHR